MTFNEVPLRRLAECLDGTRVPLNREQRADMAGDVPYWGSGGIVDHISKHLFNETLVLLGEDGAPFFDKTRPVSFVIDGPSWVNNHIHVLRPRAIDPRFLHYALNAVDYGRYISGSTRDKLTQEEMWTIRVPYPAADEQRRIADFLDDQATRLNSAVALQLGQQARSADRRQSFIAERLGVSDRLLEVAEGSATSCHGWPTRKLSQLLAESLGGGTPSTSDSSYWTDPPAGTPWISIGDMQEGGTTSPPLKHVTEAGLEAARLRPAPAGTVLFAMYASVGKTSIAATRSVWNQAILGLVPGPDLRPRYLLYWLELIRRVLTAIARSSTQDNLNGEQVRSLHLPLPSLHEQDDLIQVIAAEDAAATELASLRERQIALLEERKQALVAAAVTGQLDVTTARKVA
ncbi:restriction endonuclease subunit S [Geodermatophilus sp. URMC 60]